MPPVDTTIPIAQASETLTRCWRAMSQVQTGPATIRATLSKMRDVLVMTEKHIARANVCNGSKSRGKYG